MGDLHKAFACSAFRICKLWGVVAGGWQMARAALRSPATKSPRAIVERRVLYTAKLATAKFYASHVLTQSAWYAKRQIMDGSSAT